MSDGSSDAGPVACLAVADICDRQVLAETASSRSTPTAASQFDDGATAGHEMSRPQRSYFWVVQVPKATATTSHPRLAVCRVACTLSPATGRIGRFVWEGRFGAMLIEVKDGNTFVNGQRVEPFASTAALRE